jgi:hypothetical protein
MVPFLETHHESSEVDIDVFDLVSTCGVFSAELEDPARQSMVRPSSAIVKH